MCIITRFYHITRSKAAVKGTTGCIVDYSAYPAGGNKVADHRELYPGLALHSGNNIFIGTFDQWLYPRAQMTRTKGKGTASQDPRILE